MDKLKSIGEEIQFKNFDEYWVVDRLAFKLKNIYLSPDASNLPFTKHGIGSDRRTALNELTPNSDSAYIGFEAGNIKYNTRRHQLHLNTKQELHR